MYSLIHKVYAASGGEFNPKRLNQRFLFNHERHEKYKSFFASSAFFAVKTFCGTIEAVF
jgi:hypothetical protein